MQHRGLVSGQPPRPGATAASRLAQRGEPDIVLSRERDEIAGNVRVAQVRRFGHTATLLTQIPAMRRSQVREAPQSPILRPSSDRERAGRPVPVSRSASGAATTCASYPPARCRHRSAGRSSHCARGRGRSRWSAGGSWRSTAAAGPSASTTSTVRSDACPGPHIQKALWPESTGGRWSAEPRTSRAAASGCFAEPRPRASATAPGSYSRSARSAAARAAPPGATGR